MGFDLAGKVALVTGAGRGVGQSDAEILAENGATVLCADIDPHSAKTTAAGIDHAFSMTLDVSCETSWQDAVTQIEREHGRLDVLVNNAAILAVGDVVEESLENWRRMFGVNTEGVFLGIKYCMPLLERAGSASIINMCSTAALNGMPHFTAYSASKAAVKGLTQSVAVYCRQQDKGVRCNALYPDGIATPMVMELLENVGGRQLADPERAARYACQPQEVAHTVLFLAADESRHINGASITVDGGASVTPPYL